MMFYLSVFCKDELIKPFFLSYNFLYLNTRSKREWTMFLWLSKNFVPIHRLCVTSFEASTCCCFVDRFFIDDMVKSSITILIYNRGRETCYRSMTVLHIFYSNQYHKHSLLSCSRFILCKYKSPLLILAVNCVCWRFHPTLRGSDELDFVGHKKMTIAHLRRQLCMLTFPSDTARKWWVGFCRT
jgi:hypothetical protein